MMSKSFFHKFRFILIVSFLIIVLDACSAGGGETGTGGNDPIAVQDTSVSVGVITGFGSVFVNNVEYETSSETSVSLDGLSLSESDLAVGMLVTISGSVNADGLTGSASAIIFEDNVEGVVLSNDLVSGGDLNVLGQTILIDDETIFESKDPTVTIVEEIKVGQVLEVSGYSNGDGNIFATRIELKRDSFSVGEELEIKGVVSNVSLIDFTVGSLTVNYETAELNDFDSSLKNGDFVSVKSKQAISVDNVLTASSIKLKSKSKISSFIQGDKDTNKEIEFEGVVSSVSQNSDRFILNTETVLVSATTNFENGDISNLVDRVRVKIKANLNADGNIVAEEIKFKPVSVNYLEGPIEKLNATDRIITVYGVDIMLNNSTRLKDDLDGIDDVERQFFNYSRLMVGDYVEVSAYTDTQNNYIATKLERKNPESGDDTDGDSGSQFEGLDRELKGLVSDIRLNDQENIIVVSGIEIDVEALGFGGQINDRVEIHMSLVNEVWVATEIDIQDNE